MREPVSAHISCFGAPARKSFCPTIRRLLLNPAAFGGAPHSYVLGEGEEVDDHPHNPYDRFVLAAVQTQRSRQFNKPVTIFLIRMKVDRGLIEAGLPTRRNIAPFAHPRLVHKAAPRCSRSALRNSMRC